MNETARTNWEEMEAVENAVTQTDEQKKELGRKNRVVGLALMAFVVLIFFVTMAKLAGNFGG